VGALGVRIKLCLAKWAQRKNYNQGRGSSASISDGENYEKSMWDEGA
jgi:hypothetical protein